MAKPKSEQISRRSFIGVSVGTALVAGIGCGTDSPAPEQNSGAGQPGTGGSGAPSNGGTASSSGGASTSPTGNGGTTATTGPTGGGGAGTTTGPTGAGGTSTTTGPTGAGGTSATTGPTGAGGTGATGAGGTSSSKTTGNGGASTGGAGKGGTTATGGTTTGAAGKTGNAGGTTATGGSATGGAAGSSAGDTPLVALVRGTDWAQATMDAIAKIGLPDLKGKKVVIRPNQIEAKPDGTTNPEVIRGVIRAIKAASSGAPASIVVAEDAFGGPAATNMQTNGITAVCTEEGATTLDLSGTATTNRKPTNAAAWTNGLDFYNAVYDADYVINVPRCKTHGLANFSMALKAWFGSIKRPGSTELHGSIHNKCAEAHLARKEDFVVLDASRCMISGGPSQSQDRSNMKDSKIVVASKDAIAADVTGIAIIRYNGGSLAAPWTQNQIKRAMAIAVQGWLTAQQDFPYWSSGIPEIADIMAKRV